MPGPPVGVDSRVGDLGESLMDAASLLSRSRSVSRRADDRMPEPDPSAELREAGLDGG
jgi:hypothetical protein